MAYVSLTFPTDYGYTIEVTRSGAAYVNVGGTLRRLDSLNTRRGVELEGPDGRRFTVSWTGKITDHSKENDDEAGDI